VSTNTTEAATDLLRDAMLMTLHPVGPAVVAVKTAQTKLRDAEHITEAFLAAGALILAIEALEDVANNAAGVSRAILREQMADAGCYSLGGEAFSLTLADAPRSVQITDPSALPPEMMTTPEPQPDRKAIAAALKNGPVPGAALSNGGAPTLRISPKRTK
jgi:hypothetical protein